MNFKLTSKSVKKNSLINGIIIIGMLFSQVSSVYAQNGSTETPTISSTEEVTITPKPTSETTVVMTEEPTSEPTATSSIETLTPTATAETPTVDLSTPTLTAVPTDVSAPTSVQSELEEFSWTLTINISKEQADALASLEYNVISDLQGHGVTVEFDDVQLRLYGSADLEQLRQVAYGDLSPIVDYLGGGVALNIYMPVTAGGLVNVSLESRLSTGYIWAGQFDDTSVFTEKSDASFDQQYPGSGSPTIQTMHLQATEDGAGHIHLLYQRSWESSPIVSTINIYLQEMTPTIDLSNPSPMKLIQEDSLKSPETLQSLSDQELPASFDWRSFGIVSEVRDQNPCGACWAFGTVGIMESAIKKAGGPLVDLSEQFLVSCNNSSWSCSGGLTASAYHYDQLGMNQNEIGAVLEESMPYTASNGTCTASYDHPYQLSNWQFITGSEWTIPTVSQVKDAIYTYGPVTALICAGPNFNKYKGGVMNATDDCDGTTNHQIILVGWDDATSSWILRNSWGTNWGESGYMRIGWGVSRVGQGASWVLMSIKPTVSVEQSAGQSDTTENGKVYFTASFSEPIDVTSFVPEDITLEGTAAPTTAIITEVAPNNGTTFSIEVSGMTSSGTVIASIAAGKVIDLHGDSNTASTSVDNSITFSKIITIDTTDHSTCVLFENGIMECWGDMHPYVPTILNPQIVDFMEPMMDISIGWGRSCGLTIDGGMQCWGENIAGSVGNGTTIDQPYPVDVVGLSTGVTTISATRAEYTCALTNLGGVKCWGYDGGGWGIYTTPQDIPDLETGVTKLKSSIWHTCVLTSSGGVKCWGNNNFGQIGIGTHNWVTDPVDVTGLTIGVKDIFVGDANTCALKTDGTLKCWGMNDFGQLGDGTTNDQSLPIDVTPMFGSVKDIALGTNHTCVLSDFGGVKCWGGNEYGQLGNGTFIDSATPTNVIGLTSGVSEISTNESHTCVLLDTGTVKCWGQNDDYQLGDGTTINRSSPVELTWKFNYSISGMVKNPDGSGLGGVTVSDETGNSTLTDESGNYILTGVDIGSHTLTAYKNGYAPFVPGSITVNITDSNVTGQNFTSAQKPWLMMYYIAADNNLSDKSSMSLEELRKKQNQENYNIAIMVDSEGSNGSQFYYISDSVTQIQKGELNSGSPDTLVEFVNWARSQAPTQFSALTIDGHGSLTAVAQDETSNDDDIELKELGDAFQEITATGGMIDIVYMAACSMGTLEAGYELRQYVDYYIASENISWTNIDFGYLDLIQETTQPEELSISIANAYHNEKNYLPHTISVARLSTAQSLTEKVNTFAGLLKSKMGSIADILLRTEVLSEVQRFHSDIIICSIGLTDEAIDLYDFARLINEKSSDQELKDASVVVMQAIENNSDKYIIYNKSISRSIPPDAQDCANSIWDLDHGHGVSIFFSKPENKRSFYTGATLSFALGTDWEIMGPLMSVMATENTNEWGPMLVEYVTYAYPDAVDDPNPPLLQQPWQLYLVPSINSISPELKPAGTAVFTLTVNGDNFIHGSIIRWNGIDQITTFISDTQLQTSISDLLNASAGSATVTVFNPTPGGGESSGIQFIIENPVPIVEKITPDYRLVGDPDFTITIEGTGFTEESVVRWNGQDRNTVFHNQTRLDVQILASDITSTGIANITVHNPEPGEGLSNLLQFTIEAVPGTYITINQDATPGFIKKIASDPQNLSTIYIGTTRIYKSEDSGKTLTELGLLGLPAYGSVYGIAVDPIDSSKIYAGELKGLFKSLNGGETWQLVYDYYSKGCLAASLVISESNPSIIFADCKSSILKSDDEGISWVDIATGLPSINKIVIDPINSNYVFIITNDNILYRSLDGGFTWTLIKNNTFDLVFSADYEDSQSIYIGTTTGIKTSTDLGMNWADKSQGFDSWDKYVYGLLINPSDSTMLFAKTASNNLYISLDTAATWKKIMANVDDNYTLTATNPVQMIFSWQSTIYSIVFIKPKINDVSPTSKNTDDKEFTLTVNGEYFTRNASVLWGNTPLVTTFVSSTRVTALVPASLLTTAGLVNISVASANSGNGVSSPITFIVEKNNPVPTISNINPSSIIEGSPTFTITVNGSQFDSSSTIKWGDQTLTTTFVNSTQLTAEVPESYLTNANVFDVTVYNPPLGGGNSNKKAFIVNYSDQSAISDLDPTEKIHGETSFELTVNGSNFLSASVVRLNGNDRPTTFINQNQLKAQIPASDISSIGMINVTVFTPGAGGGNSISKQLPVITNPVITRIAPLSQITGGDDFSLDIFGTDFSEYSTILWNGEPLSTEFISNTHLFANVDALKIIHEGMIEITVFSENPVKTYSNSVTLMIENPAPGITHISPNIYPASGEDLILRVNGNNFVNSSVVMMDTIELETTFITKAQLNAQLPSELLNDLGSYDVTVINTVPGGGTSNSLAFTVFGYSPNYDQKLNTNKVTLDWDDIPGANQYAIQLSLSNTFSTTILNTTTTTSNYNYSTALTNGKTYYWRFRPKFGTVLGDWTPALRFYSMNPPLAPVQVAPLTASFTNDITPELTWNAVTNGARYQVQISKSSTFLPTLQDKALEEGVLSYTADELTTDGLYYWKVRAIDSVGVNGAWSAVRSFTVDTVKPAAPLLSAPAALATVRGTPAYTWSIPSGAKAYIFEYDNDEDFSTPIYTSGELTTNKVTPPLQDPGIYYWHVKVRDAAGNWSVDWSISRRVTIRPVVPVAPALVSPVSSAYTNDTTPNLSWNAVPYAVKYKVQLSKSSIFSDVNIVDSEIVNSPDLNIDVETNGDRVYYWRVCGINSEEVCGSWSTVKSFTVDTVAQAVPVMTSPINGATAVTVIPTMVVKAVSGAKTYEYKFSASESMEPIVQTASTTALSYVLPTTKALPFGTIYYHVRSVDAAGNASAWSAPYSFVVTILKAPAKKTVMVTSTTARPAFSWTAVSGATGYKLQIGMVGDDFGPVVLQKDLGKVSTYTLTTLEALPANKYEWRMCVKMGADCSDYTPVYTFTVTAAPPAAPALLTPTSGLFTNDSTPALTWSPSTNAVKYGVQISKTSTFTTLEQTGILENELTYTATELLDGVHYWRVRAINNLDVPGSWSAAKNFTVDTVAQAVPVMTSPINGATAVTVIPTMVVKAVSGAKTYEYEFSTSITMDPIVQTASTTVLSYILPTTKALPFGTIYYHVRSVDAAGNASAWSAPYSFVVTILKAPANKAVMVTSTTARPAFSWTAVSGATGYKLQIGMVGDDFGPVVLQKDLGKVSTYTLTTLEALPANKYEWRMCVKMGADCSDYTPVYTFTVTAAPPAAPVLLAPASGLFTNDSTPALTWSPSTNAVKYGVQISKTSTFTTLEQTGILENELTYTATELLDGVHYWRVRAINNLDVPGSWSAAKNFTVDTVAQAVPVMTSPINGATAVTVIPTMVVKAVSGAKTYEYEFSTSDTMDPVIQSASTIAT